MLERCTVNETNDRDTLFPITRQLLSDHIVFRGEFEKLTLVVFGAILAPEEEKLIAMHNAENVPLAAIQ